MLGKRSEAVEGSPQNLLPVAFSGTKPVFLFFLPSSVTCQRCIKKRRISDQAESFPHAAKGRGHILDFKNLAQAINSEKKKKRGLPKKDKKRKKKQSLPDRTGTDPEERLTEERSGAAEERLSRECGSYLQTSTLQKKAGKRRGGKKLKKSRL